MSLAEGHPFKHAQQNVMQKKKNCMQGLVVTITHISATRQIVIGWSVVTAISTKKCVQNILFTTLLSSPAVPIRCSGKKSLIREWEDDIPESCGISALRLSREQTERPHQLAKQYLIERACPTCHTDSQQQPFWSPACYCVFVFCNASTNHWSRYNNRGEQTWEECLSVKTSSNRVSLRVIQSCKEATFANCWILQCCLFNVCILVTHSKRFEDFCPTFHWSGHEEVFRIITVVIIIIIILKYGVLISQNPSCNLKLRTT